MTRSFPPPAAGQPDLERPSGGRFLALVRLLTAGPWAALKVAVFCWALSTFLSSPSLFMWSWDHILFHTRAQDLLALCADPLTRHLREPIVGYRLALPLLAHPLHLSPVLVLALPYVANLGFLALVYAALRRRIEPRPALSGTVIVALSFAFMWTNWQPGFTDSLSHALAASLLLTLSGPWTAVAIFFGLLNDERMVLALPFVLLWHFPLHRDANGAHAALLRWIAAAGAGFVAYGVLRHGLAAGWIGPGLTSPAVYLEMQTNLRTFHPKLGSWLVWSVNAFQSFRWAWLIILVFSFRLFARRHWFLALVFCGTLIGGLLATALVQDVGRSIGFMFPAWLVALAGSARTAEPPSQRTVRWIVIGLVLTPVFFTFEEFKPHWMRPLPLVLVRCLGPASAAPSP